MSLVSVAVLRRLIVWNPGAQVAVAFRKASGPAQLTVASGGPPSTSIVKYPLPGERAYQISIVSIRFVGVKECEWVLGWPRRNPPQRVPEDLVLLIAQPERLSRASKS